MARLSLTQAILCFKPLLRAFKLTKTFPHTCQLTTCFQMRHCSGGQGRKRFAESFDQSQRQSKRRVIIHAVSLPDLQAHKGKVIVVDNYDSFTYNLSQYLGSLKCEHIVVKNDELTVEQIDDLNPRGILLSPGPGVPEDSGISLQVVADLGSQYPIFGVCMGHQCIGQTFGARIVRAPCGVMHGKASPVLHNSIGHLKDLSNPFQAARYHSLVIEKESCPNCLEIIAETEDGTIMAVQHRDIPHIQGVQFHPESIITSNGMTIMANFMHSL